MAAAEGPDGSRTTGGAAAAPADSPGPGSAEAAPAPFAPLTLEGTHVRLEPLRFAHIDALYAATADPELWQWTVAQVRNRDEMRRFIEKALLQTRQGTSVAFLTVERATGAVAGTTRFMNYSRPDRRVEIGSTVVGKAWQRTAINTEAKLLMLTHAFERLRLLRVELKTDRLNTRSRAAIARLGAIEEGTLRQHVKTEAGRQRDSVYFSITHEEWPGVKAGLSEKLARSPGRP